MPSSPRKRASNAGSVKSSRTARTAKAVKAAKPAKAARPAKGATAPAPPKPAKRPARKADSRPAADRPAGEEPLARYRAKRNFERTPEPGVAPRKLSRSGPARPRAPAFVIQKHWARRLHYDFRLEHGGVLLSWAVPKGPSFDPADKRLAVHVEDHPVEYGGFEGAIPAGEYGAGDVIVWDRGTWEPLVDPDQGMRDGKLVFALHGEKLAGQWELIRTRKVESGKEQWLLFKKRDAWSRPRAEYDVITALPDSVVTHPLGPVESREPRAEADGGDPPARPTRRRAAAPKSGTDLAQAPRAALPRALEPQLARLVESAPAGGDWIVEPKYDGYRVLARIEDGKARLFTRRSLDWTDRMPSLARAFGKLAVDSAWIDGEIVVNDAEGMADFNALQNALDESRSERIVFFAFDLPFLDGRDLRRLPLRARRAALERLVPEGAGDGRIRFSRDFEAPPSQMLEAACQLGLEGIMLKRADAPYASTRSDAWLKLKCSQRQEFVVGGFTDRQGAPKEVGGLLLGYYEDGKLRHAGNVGTGWDAGTARSLRAALARLETDKPPFDGGVAGPGRWSRRAAGGEHWVRPEMVVEVAFSGWTPDARLRHPSFKGVREDKPPKEVIREAPARLGRAAAGNGDAGRSHPAASPAGTSRARDGKTRAAGVSISNPERVVDPESGLTKLDLVRYYEAVADRILPHLRERPVSLVRVPEGIGSEHFFQKHPESRMPGLTTLDPSLWPGHGPLLSVESVEALVNAAQMNVIEFHTWNSTVRHIDQPDHMVFDLDPGEGVEWKHLQEAALLARTLLEELGLRSWLKTSGGKGLHIVVPVAPRFDHRVIKGFTRAVVLHLARTIPSRFVARSGAANRKGKIFVDYLRNGHGQTTVSAFSARARPGLGVSMPVAWEDLMSLRASAQWTVANAREHLSFERADPWAEYFSARQPLAGAMKILGYDATPPAARRRAGVD